MTKVFVNNQSIEFSEQKEFSLGGLVDYLLNEYLDSKEILIDVDLNGESFLINESILAFNIKDFDTISFQSKPGMDVIIESINSCSLYLKCGPKTSPFRESM